MKVNEIKEGLKDPKDNPCWKGYKPVGTKKKDGKTVPNCVPNESVEEASTGKITDIKPGQSATIQTAPGMTTTIDLKANPTALTKDENGKLKLTTKPATGPTGQPQNEPELPKAGDDIEIDTTEAAGEQPPPMPDVTGLQPGQAKDLGQGQKVVVNQDGTVSLWGGFGIYTYDKTGKAIKHDAPNLAGVGQSTDLTTGKTTKSYDQGPFKVKQGPDGELDGEYDLGLGVAKVSRDAQGKTTGKMDWRQTEELNKLLTIAGLK